MQTATVRDTRRRRLAVVLGISGVIFAAEFVAGLVANSLALLTDSVHVFTDATAIAIALGATVLAGRPANDRRTYGNVRFEILAALLNAALLLGLGIFVAVEAIRRLAERPAIHTGPMLAVALVGLVGNTVATALLREPAGTNLNMRAAYLEMLSDLLGSLAVIAAAIAIALTGFGPADALASVFIGILILPRAWRIIRDAVDVLLESAPRDVETAHVREHILGTLGVLDVHDLHVWMLTSGINVVSAHVVVEDGASPAAVLSELARCLSDDFDIEHSTFQLEDRRHTHLGALTHP